MGWHLGGAVKTDHAAIERILAKEIHGVLRQIYRKVRRIVVTETVVEVLDPRRPPLDVDVCEVDATAALEDRALTARNGNRDRVMDDRIEPQMERAGARLVKLRPHRRVLKLE